MESLRLPHPGELELSRNLRRSRSQARSTQRRERLRSWWRKLMGERATEAPETFEKLKGELAEARYQAGLAKEARERAEYEREALKAQVQTLLAQVDPSDLGETAAKAAAFDSLTPELATLSKWAEGLHGVERRLAMRRVLMRLGEELKSARDGFQKIKLYRKYLNRFSEFPELQGLVEPFRQDRERIKDRAQVEALLEGLKALTDAEKEMENLAESGGALLERVRKALGPWRREEEKRT
ncbi:MAG: hypothetical protein J0L75_10355 [Spirochaetes bacterium]|nr:hypothetical protein [Spirochaetota bacterium]